MYLRLTLGQFDPSRYDDIKQVIPDVVSAIRALPGVQNVQVGVDRATGRTLALTTIDTLENARFSRDSLAQPLRQLQALGWRGEAPEIFEVTE